MKKRFKLSEIDCASCAAKIEHAIKKLDGVSDATVNFITQSLTIDAKDELFEQIIKRAEKICRSIEPDCKIII